MTVGTRGACWRFSARLKVEPRDLWVGVFWRWRTLTSRRFWRLEVFICVVPCLPLHVTVSRMVTIEVGPATMRGVKP